MNSSLLAVPQEDGTWVRRLLAVYLVNATFVICHEIDSARWSEWDLFRIPGGPVLFVAVHLLLVPLILLGLVQIARGQPASRYTSLAVGVAGFAGCMAHAAFLIMGDDRFGTPFSVGLIVAFGISSALLLVMVIWGIFNKRFER